MRFSEYLDHFAFLVFVHTIKIKLQARSVPYVFLGYAPKHKGYLCLEVESNKVYTTRGVSRK